MVARVHSPWRAERKDRNPIAPYSPDGKTSRPQNEEKTAAAGWAELVCHVMIENKKQR